MLQRTDVAYMKIHFDTEEQFPEDITSENEIDILAKHEDAIEASTVLASRLIALGTVHKEASSLMNRVTELQQTIPTKSFDPIIQELADDYKKLNSTLRKSKTIGSDESYLNSTRSS